MSLDFPASASVLWMIYDKTGVRPEWLVPVLAFESGLDPSIPNRAGAPYYGINQASEGKISAAGASSVQEYLSWPASRQLSLVVEPMVEGLVNQFGPIRSATRMEQANFLPATLPEATTLDSIISQQDDPYYGGNKAFDAAGKGYITLGDLATVMSRTVSQKYVQNVLAQIYSYRPNEVMEDPVYGEDFPLGGIPWRFLMAGGLAGGLWWGIRTGRLKRWLRAKVPVVARVLP